MYRNFQISGHVETQIVTHVGVHDVEFVIEVGAFNEQEARDVAECLFEAHTAVEIENVIEVHGE